MNDRDLAVLLAVLAVAVGRGDQPERKGLVSRIAARATGRVVDVVDPNIVLAGVDLDALIARIDVDALLARMDIDALMERIDINALLDRVDLDAVLERIDMEELAARSGIPDIVRESTGALAGSAVDVLRRQLASVDVLMSRAAYRLTGRSPSDRPDAPAAAGTAEDAEGSITGRYAGPVTRLFAFIADALIVWSVWTMTVLGVTFVADVFTRRGLDPTGPQAVIGVVALAVLSFTYFSLGLSIAGRTVGMGLIGLRVVARDGTRLSGRAAIVRTLVFPFSLIPFGIGFLGILIGRERRALHDVAGGSAVVYDWGDRPAELQATLQEWMTRERR